jgi:Thiamine pyrophosphate enzyme, N-terminal TPP binding domain
MSEIKSSQQTAAQLLIRSLVQQNVEHIFGIPGGKIMPTFDVLNDEGQRLIVCPARTERRVHGRCRWALDWKAWSLSCHFGAGHRQSGDRRGHRHYRRRSDGCHRRRCSLAG